MTTEKFHDAARILGDAAARHARIDVLPAHLRPKNFEETYQIQSALVSQAGELVMGLKIAATSRAGQEHIGIDNPISGQLLASQVLAPGDTAQMKDNLMQAAEAEFVFEFASPVKPRRAPYSWQEVMTSVGHLRLGIELPDSRYRFFSKAGVTQLVADNAVAALLVLGPPAADWREQDLSRHAVTVKVNGEAVDQGSGANVLGDPRNVLVWLANELSGRGLGLEAGQVVTTGSAADVIAVNPGDTVVADFGDLGVAQASFG